MTERGESPPSGGFNKVGEGSGHKVKKGKGKGYARSSHHEGLVGPRDGGNPHTGSFKTAEHKEHGSAHKLPGEKHIGFRKGIDAGDHFEGEINQHFPNKKGIAGINKTAMPQSNETTPHEKVSHEHGRPSGKAEHHPGMDKSNVGPMYKHAMHDHPQTLSHGFGHSGDQRRGVFRLSGHKGAHMLGKRCK